MSAGPPSAADSGGGLAQRYLPLPTPRVVIFDVDFTLLRPGDAFEAPGYLRTGERFGMRLDASRWPDAERAAARAYVGFRERRGLTHDDEVMTAIAEAVIIALGGGPPHLVRRCAGAVIAEWHDLSNYDLYDDVRPCLQSLARAGVRVALLSNTSRDLMEAVELFELVPFVSTVIASAEVGVVKPDPRIFAVALARLGESAEHVVMVGDSLIDDVRGAEAAGIAGIWLARAGRPSDESTPSIRSLTELPAALGI
jgi:HAD superfamily hydrolase (TIGR01549 family)